MTTRTVGVALVIDDSTCMRSILARLLQGLGWETREAADGRQALALLESGCRPDMAFVDWNMPVMNGLDLVTAVRSDPELQRLRLVMVSSESELGQIAVALDAGADEYIVKPFTGDALAEKIALVTGAVARR